MQLSPRNYTQNKSNESKIDLLKRNMRSTVIWKFRHRHLGISIGIDVGIDIGIAKNLFYIIKFLFLPFEVLYEENIHCGAIFKYIFWPSW